ncbi:hypothetical protein GCM10022393_08710 [Aquimarina addita]|uniref:Thiosulfate dehydrogenase [quinone] large subunit n=1 Tax=Aquimarina addita TaxID=870485 RepID=A0ABP7XC65_9FLAO
MNTDQAAFFFGRIAIGVNFLVHGIVRIPKLSQFTEGMIKGFSETWLPEILVYSFAFSLPFLELFIGIFLFLGLKTKESLMTGGFLIIILIFGTGLKEDWSLVSSQMIYVIFFFLMLKNVNFNSYSLDTFKKTRIEGFRSAK